jgi:hypothetical protein
MKTHRKKLVKATEVYVSFKRSVKEEGGMKLVVSIACLVSPVIILGIIVAESNAYSDGGGLLSGVDILIYRCTVNQIYMIRRRTIHLDTRPCSNTFFLFISFGDLEREQTVAVIFHLLVGVLG